MQSLITEKAATLVLSAAPDGIGGASRQDDAPTCGFAQRDQLAGFRPPLHAQTVTCRSGLQAASQRDGTLQSKR